MNGEPREVRGDLCPHSDHRAPDPIDEPTTCPCGVLTRMPPARPKEPRP